MKKLLTVPLALSLALSLALGAALAGCAGQDASGGAGGESPGGGGKPADEATYKPADVDARVVQGHNGFAFELLRDAVRREDGNVFLSPSSAALALAMTMNGAAGETLDGMRRALQWEDLEPEDINRSHRALADVLAHSGEAVRIDIANSLWKDEGFSFLPSFLDTNKTYYDAEIADVDLQSEDAVSRINGWVNERTEGKIDSLIDGPQLEDAMLLLLNAIYFDAAWASPFPEEQTAEHSFRRQDGSSVAAPTMFRNGKLRYVDGDGFQAVRLPYQGDDLAMLVFVPDEGEELAGFVERLTPSFWSGQLNKFAEASGRLGLPKFRIEYETTLNETLVSLGMEAAFNPDEADFSAMSEGAPDNDVHIAEVKQKTYVDVAEQGTVAAAATSVIMGATSAPSLSFDLVVDRPFVFAIHDGRTDSILFIGAVNDPTLGR